MKPLVLQTDFGLADGAVSAMYGVAYSVNADLKIFDLTHEIVPYRIWEASYRLVQTVPYWPEGTVFVSVVDPGVGSKRRSVVARTKTGHYIVTPDNGTLTHADEILGIAEVRSIDEMTNRRPCSEESYTFHGRDVYVYCAAKLAAGIITYEQVGPAFSTEEIVRFPIEPLVEDAHSVTGSIDVLDVRFGSLWTNIPSEAFKKLSIEAGERAEITICHDRETLYRHKVLYGHSFADASVGEPILYVNSLNRMALAINQGSFAKAYSIGTGNDWKLTIRAKDAGENII